MKLVARALAMILLVLGAATMPAAQPRADAARLEQQLIGS